MKRLQKILALVLALLTLLSAVSCGEGGADVTTQTTTPEVTTTTPAPNTPTTPDPNDGDYKITVINGTVNTRYKEAKFDAGEKVWICVGAPANGYTFSHWVNSKGVKVSEESRFEITVSTNETYKAYFKLYFESGGEELSGLPIGSYWDAELEDTVTKVEAIRDSASTHLSEFFYLTDPHWLDNRKFSPALINHLAETLENPFLVYGGDMIVRYNSKKQSAIDDEINAFFSALCGMTEYGETIRVMSTLGNHDRNGSSNCPSVLLRLSEREAYELYKFKDMEEWGVTIAENNPNASYYDDTKNRVRYIQFYLSDSKWGMIEDGYVEPALTWVEEQVKALSEDWTVVLITHGYYGGSDWTATEINKGIKDRILRLKAEADAEIACWITGHIHRDHTETFVSEDGETELLMIVHNADGISYGQNMKANTVTEQSFSYFQIDTVNKKIHMTRVGAGEDAEYTYGTPTLDDEQGSNVDPADTVTLSVANGQFTNGESTLTLKKGGFARMTAAVAPNGYRFSHWENADGENIGNEATVTVNATENASYKAYYEVFFGDNGGETILSDLATEWQQGGFSGDLKSFNVGANATGHRVSIAEPYFLTAGSTIRVQCPIGYENPADCPWETDGNSSTTAPCAGGCRLTVGFMVLRKNEGSNTGALLTDYTPVGAATWKGETVTFTATEDCYVMFTVKFDKHGSHPFTLAHPAMQGVNVNVTKAGAPVPVGSYWEEEIEDAISKIEANRTAIGTNISEFFFMADTHWLDNAQYSPAILNYIADEIDAHTVIFAGDVIKRYNPVKQDAIDCEINAFFGALEHYTKRGAQLKIMTALGNHDRNGSSNCPSAGLRLTEEEAYELYLSRMEGWGVTVEGDPNKCYFDDADNKVRYVQFYFSGSQHGMTEDNYVDAAMAWAEEKILELSSDWTVVLITHGVFCGAKGTANEYTPKDKVVMERMLALQGNADAEIAVWLTGHIHEERNEILTDAAGNKLRLVSLNCDAYGNSNTSTNGLLTSYQMTPGTTTEQSFSFIQLDLDQKKIYLTRVGAGDDVVLDYGANIGTATVVVPEL